jgi:HAD superfamily phosphoserine phosphatase-like hydrolase
MKFLFDLDGTLTKFETLPILVEEFGLSTDILELTKNTVKGIIPFQESFIKRVSILGNLPVDSVRKVLAEIDLFDRIIEFIKENKNDCIVLTGNLDVWVSGLIEKIGCDFYTSEAIVKDNKIEKITKIIKKDDVVRELQQRGEKVVYVGDGNNDSEAMRLADISIACGLVHSPLNSVIEVSDFLVFEDASLFRLLNQIKTPPQKGKSLVISAAGIGSRLGMTKTKALLEFNGQSLIQHHINFFSTAIEDIRVVVGFESASVISSVIEINRDVIFVFNHDYFHTKTCQSLYLGSRHANDLVLGWDGDLVVFSEDIYQCLNAESEFAGCSAIKTEDGIFVKSDMKDIHEFTTQPTDLLWSGPLLIKRDRILNEVGNVYEMLSRYLPFPLLKIQAFDIDTYSDYERAKKYFDQWNFSNSKAINYYDQLAKKIKNPIEIRNKAPDHSYYDIGVVKRFSGKNKELLDLGSGTGLLINNLTNDFKKIIAIEKYKKFSNFINKSKKIKVVNKDVLDLEIDRNYDVITAFGLMNFFNFQEASGVYKKVFDLLEQNGIFIVKHQMGVDEDVVEDAYSSELGCNYFSNYRSLQNESDLLKKIGFRIQEIIDIYPDKFNRWDNTHFYAIVCSK